MRMLRIYPSSETLVAATGCRGGGKGAALLEYLTTHVECSVK